MRSTVRYDEHYHHIQLHASLNGIRKLIANPEGYDLQVLHESEVFLLNEIEELEADIFPMQSKTATGEGDCVDASVLEKTVAFSIPLVSSEDKGVGHVYEL